MAKDRLKEVSVKIGTALGKGNRKAHQVVEARTMAKRELQEIAKQVDALRKQLEKTTKRLKKALS